MGGIHLGRWSTPWGPTRRRSPSAYGFDASVSGEDAETLHKLMAIGNSEQRLEFLASPPSRLAARVAANPTRATVREQDPG